MIHCEPHENNNKIGVENNIYVANKLDVKKLADVEDSTTLKPGDRVLIVKGPDGKIFPSYVDETGATVYGTYKNPAYTTKVPETYSMPYLTTGMLVDVDTTDTVDGKKLTNVNFDEVNQFVFGFADSATTTLNPATVGAVGVTGETVYAKAGTYTLTIKTVKFIDTNEYLYEEDANNAGTHVLRNGIYVDKSTLAPEQLVTGEKTYNVTANANPAYNTIQFTKSNGLTSTVKVTVSNGNAPINYTGRVLTRVEDTSISTYNFAGSFDHDDRYTINAEYGDDEATKKLIMSAFKFDKELEWNDILYYTYTYTGSNKQVVINSVTFRVPAKGNTGLWYRSTVTVNKSLTFDFE